MMVKICGMKDATNIQAISELKPDFMGFIFYPLSKRYVGTNFDPEILTKLPTNISKVGVFVNEDLEKIIEIQKLYQFDFVQLHGDESVSYCELLFKSGIKIIKAFGIHAQFNFGDIEVYKPYCNYFLFDTFTKDYGGSGKRFNWKVLSNNAIDHPYLLSGGIGLEEIQSIIDLKLTHCIGIDANSKLEVSPGNKHIITTKTVINQLKNGKI